MVEQWTPNPLMWVQSLLPLPKLNNTQRSDSMTWGQIQLDSIRKMFINTTAIATTDLPTMRTDKKYVTYLDAMPDTATEGLMILATRGKPIINRAVLTVASATSDYSIDGFYCFDVGALSNYIGLESVYVDGGTYNGYILRDNKYLYIPKEVSDNHTIAVSYNSCPKITSSTLDTDIIVAPEEMLIILPLYIASELYKDDDIALATYYRNEFETELENMRKQPTDIHFIDVKGWL